MKFVDSNKIESEVEVQLYLMILELQVSLSESFLVPKIAYFHQEKYSEALDLINGDLGNILASHPNLLEVKRCEFLAKLKRWDQLLCLLEELLNKK